MPTGEPLHSSHFISFSPYRFKLQRVKFSDSRVLAAVARVNHQQGTDYALAYGTEMAKTYLTVASIGFGGVGAFAGKALARLGTNVGLINESISALSDLDSAVNGNVLSSIGKHLLSVGVMSYSKGFYGFTNKIPGLSNFERGIVHSINNTISGGAGYAIGKINLE